LRYEKSPEIYVGHLHTPNFSSYFVYCQMVEWTWTKNYYSKSTKPHFSVGFLITTPLYSVFLCTW